MEEIVCKYVVKNVICLGHVIKRLEVVMVVVYRDGNFFCVIKVFVLLFFE